MSPRLALFAMCFHTLAVVALVAMAILFDLLEAGYMPFVCLLALPLPISGFIHAANGYRPCDIDTFFNGIGR